MIQKINKWLASFLELQLIISLLSLPILIHWGLAVSYMIPLANLIFAPLLALFLWCSCLFALFAIAHIPCSWLVVLLDWLANVWHYFLSFATPCWLIGFQHRMIWIAIFCASCVFFVYSFFYPRKKISLIFLIFCCVFLFSIRWITIQKNCFYSVNNMPLHVLRVNNKIYLLDSGALCSKQNFYSWIDYTILPELIKSGGITIIDTLVLYKPNKKLVKIVQQFAKQTMIKTILVNDKFGCYDEIKQAFAGTTIKIIPMHLKRFNYK